VDPTALLPPVTATCGKITFAELASTLYEQGRMHHVGCFPTLEDQMCDWVAGTPESPDRMDALIWAITDLNLRSVQKIWLR
jgi:phage terminase large subunit-like protein